jgi:hypothetical protein
MLLKAAFPFCVWLCEQRSLPGCCWLSAAPNGFADRAGKAMLLTMIFGVERLIRNCSETVRMPDDHYRRGSAAPKMGCCKNPNPVPF